ncbi:MAG TPA: hypothetical protein DHV36_22070 [Desulfobacteraceae bacterium]|nr:hypothetical protein [Desulfobacteraceae bacterium]
MELKEKTAAYTSAEFRLDSPGIFFQFKLRTMAEEPMFALVNKESKAMGSLTPGDLIPMIYHFGDKTIPAEQRITRIKSVRDGSRIGYEDYYIVALEINENLYERPIKEAQ